MRPVGRLLAASARRRVRGAIPLAHALCDHRFGQTVPTRLNGLLWEADPSDWMDQQVLLTGTYEPEISDLLVDVCPPESTFWDVGANVGVHTITVAKRRPDVSVVAFEPSPRQLARLLLHARLNTVNVQAYGVALADDRGYRSLSVMDHGNSGLDSLTPWPGLAYSAVQPVWCDTGDHLAASGVPRPMVMKVDVEGAEPMVFSGSKELLRGSGLTHVIFEAPGNDQPTGSIAALLVDVGFEIERIASSGGGPGDWWAHR